MMDVNWPNLACVLLTPRLILSKSAPWHCFAKSVRHERVRAGSCLVTKSQNTSERADNQTTSARLSVSWTLFSYRWHVKVLPTCRQLLRRAAAPLYSTDGSILDQRSVGQLAWANLAACVTYILTCRRRRARGVVLSGRSPWSCTVTRQPEVQIQVLWFCKGHLV